jgi:hypothetical protein
MRTGKESTSYEDRISTLPEEILLTILRLSPAACRRSSAKKKKQYADAPLAQRKTASSGGAHPLAHHLR